MIYRKDQLKNLEELLSFNPVVGLIGPRQVGKTTLVKEFLKKNPGVYLDMELDSDRVKLSDPELYFRARKGQLLVLDEVQTIQSVFPTIRALVDEDASFGPYILLGSASPNLMKDSSESLAGRIAYLELPPLLLSDIDRIDDENLWVRGGFPKSFLQTEKRSLTWRKNFFKTYVERDLPLLGLDTDRRILELFFRMLAADNGQIWNASKFAKSLGVSSPLVTKYLHWAENTFLVRSLSAFSTNLKKRVVKSPKVYFRDSGILHSILQIPNYQSLVGLSIAGFSWEGYVIQQIVERSREKFEFFYYRTQDGAEVDIVLSKGGKAEISLEIKLSNSPKLSKGFLISIEDLGTNKNFIITPSSNRFPIHEKVEAISLLSFLEYLEEVK